MLKQTRTTGQALRVLREVLSGIDHTQREDITHVERLELMLEARRLAEQVHGLAGMLTAEADRHQSSMHVTGTPLTSMLANAENQDDKEVARSVFEARDCGTSPTGGRRSSEGCHIHWACPGDREGYGWLAQHPGRGAASASRGGVPPAREELDAR